MEAVIDINNAHSFLTAPNHANYFNGQVWILGSKQKYQQFRCNWPRTIVHAPPPSGCGVSIMSNTVWMLLESINWPSIILLFSVCCFLSLLLVLFSNNLLI